MTGRSINVALTWDEKSQEWNATTTSGPAVSTRAALYEDVMTYLRRGLSDKLGTKDFILVEAIEIPAGLQATIDRTKEATAQLAALTEEVPRLRVLVATETTAKYNLLHHHAAEFLGMSPSYLSKIKDKVAQQVTAETTNLRKAQPNARKR